LFIKLSHFPSGMFRTEYWTAMSWYSSSLVLLVCLSCVAHNDCLCTQQLSHYQLGSIPMHILSAGESMQSVQ